MIASPAPARSTSPSSGETAPKEKRSALIIGAVISLFVIGLIFWMALSGFPISRRDSDRRAEVPEKAAAVEEGSEAGDGFSTGTIRDLEEPPPLVPIPVPPPTATTTTVVTTMPPPVINPPPQTTPAPSVAPDIALQQRGEISESRAIDRLSEFLRTTNFYKQSPDCIALRSNGYRNVGYTIQAFSTCEGGSPELLDRWRVDAKTEEVFRERSDGRYLRP